MYKEFTVELSELNQVADFFIDHLFDQHDFFSFKGEMGAGKTTLVAKIIDRLSNETVSSPTYTIVNQYQVKDLKVYHFDFFRLDSAEQALDIGLLEYFDEHQKYFFEWADQIKELLPSNMVEIQIEKTSVEFERKISIQY